MKEVFDSTVWELAEQRERARALAERYAWARDARFTDWTDEQMSIDKQLIRIMRDRVRYATRFGFIWREGFKIKEDKSDE